MNKKYIILLVVVLLLSIVILNKLDNDFMNSCTNAGYSKDYCESQK